MAATARKIEDSLHLVNKEFSYMLSSVNREVLDLSGSPFSAPGKAARARFTLLLADALGEYSDAMVKISAAAELTHAASLLHDDCIDGASYRRGLPTLNSRLGANISILAGDMVMALAFDCAGKSAPELQAELVLAVKRMTEGALREENNRWKRLSPSESDAIIVLKTGALFRWCGLAACHLARRPDLLSACARIGEETGAVFQTIDDVMDLEGDTVICGKEPFKDISEGKFTLPLILALADPSTAADVEKMLKTLQSGPCSDIAPAAQLAGLLKTRGFTSAARNSAKERIKALMPLLDSLPERENAAELGRFLLALCERKA